MDTLNWFRKTDAKKFGWNKTPKNNRPDKRKGYSLGKEYRKERRKLEKSIAHKILMCINDDED